MKGMFLVISRLKKIMATTKKKTTSTKGPKKNKPGIKNSLVKNINARKKKGKSRPKKKTTISKRSYDEMENNWGKKK